MSIRRPMNGIRRAHREGRVARGVNIQTRSPEIVEMAGLAGFDHVMLDWEHGSFGTDGLVELIRAAQAVGVTAIVRTPDDQPATIKRVLDAGGEGIVVPHVGTAEQAGDVVAAARYREGENGGRRGACPSVRALGHLVDDWPAWVAHANREVFVAVSIESTAGVENAAEIAAVPGVDALFLGSFDLAHDMGFEGRSGTPEVVTQLDRVVAAAAERDLPIFATLFLGRTRDEVAAERERWIGKGARILNVVSDRRLVTEGFAERLALVDA